MNFFKLYIGDYQRDTAHLSIAEHGAYMLMLQHHYATEKPLPTGKALHRMLRAQDKTEREAIDSVASQFWRETVDGLVNDRANVEITKANAQADTNARIAREREDKRKASRNEHEKSTNRATNDQPNHSHSQTPEKNKTLSTANAVEGDSRLPPCPHQEIISLYHETLPMLPLVREWNETRQGYLRARWKAKPSLDYWEKFFKFVSESDFLTGNAEGRPGAPPFVADLEWLIRPTNYAKVIEGKYHTRAA